MTLDMQKICEICVKLDLRYPARSLIDDDYQCALAAEMLPSARDEIKRQAECITKLESNLVEERAKDGAKIPELCDIVHDELMCPVLDGDCEHWEGCPRKDELRQKAREQLRWEGKL